MALPPAHNDLDGDGTPDFLDFGDSRGDRRHLGGRTGFGSLSICMRFPEEPENKSGRRKISLVEAEKGQTSTQFALGILKCSLAVT